MDQCKHGIPSGFCATCRAFSQPPVYLSAGGDTFHRTTQCPAYLEGRRKADRAGFSLYELQRVTRLRALDLGRVSCLYCYPPRTGEDRQPVAGRFEPKIAVSHRA